EAGASVDSPTDFFAYRFAHQIGTLNFALRASAGGTKPAARRWRGVPLPPIHSESPQVSTNPAQDQTYLSQPDTGFLTKIRIADWETDKTFSTDWAGNHFFYWAELLHPLREKPIRILEIGSWEGRSALFFLNYLPRSRIVCIDPFEGNVEHHLDPYFRQLALK